MRTILVTLLLIISLVIAIPYQLIVLIIKLFDDKTSRTLSFHFLRFMSKAVFFISGTTFHIEGEEHMDTENYLVIANHRSMLDIPTIVTLAKEPVGFIGKKSLLKVPIFNLWMYMLGCLFLDRKSLKKGYSTIIKGIDKLKSGENMAIFPQGTRNRDDEFLAFKKGSFKLATESGAKIIPIMLYGTDDILEANKKLKITKADVYVKVFEAINTKDFSDEDKKELSSKIEKLVYDEYMKYKVKKDI